MCERPVHAVYMWRDHSDEGGEQAIYYHAHQEQCCIADQGITVSLSQIREHGIPRQNTGDEDGCTFRK